MASTQEFDDILVSYPGAARDKLIPILQEIQDRQGYLSREAVVAVSEHLGLPASKIYGVATFYNQFRFQAPGKYSIQVCRGTACHVKGSAAVLDELEKQLDIQAGETTEDGLFTLEVVACIGACSLAPVICIDGKFHASVTVDSVAGILESYREKSLQSA